MIKLYKFVPRQILARTTEELTMSTPHRKEYYIIRKKEAFKMFKKSLRNADIARVLRVSDSTIIQWKKELNENTTPKASKR